MAYGDDDGESYDQGTIWAKATVLFEDLDWSIFR